MRENPRYTCSGNNQIRVRDTSEIQMKIRFQSQRTVLPVGCVSKWPAEGGTMDAQSASQGKALTPQAAELLPNISLTVS